MKKFGNDVEKVVSKLVAKAWLDPSFYQRLISEPDAVLAEVGATEKLAGDTFALQFEDVYAPQDIIDVLLDTLRNPARCGCCC